MIINKQKIKKIFKSENSRFQLITGLKFSGILLVSFIFSFYLMWLVMSLNHTFFEANGFLNLEELRQAYFDRLLETSLEKIHYLALFFIIVFVAGVYVANLIVRPFQVISKYCEQRANGEEAIYNPDLFSDYKLLTRFSDYFFNQMDSALQSGESKTIDIPPHFSQIHKPHFEKVFFFHFSLIVGIILIVTTTMVHVVNIEVYENMIDLSLSSLKGHNENISTFFNKQASIRSNIQVASGLFTVSLYSLLAFNLFSRVGGAIFGFFSTMRAFLKGDYDARVHLLGYNHIRPYGRGLNKYLKYLQKEFNK